MPTLPLAGLALAASAALVYVFVAPPSADASATPAPTDGHLILQIEGDVTRLAVVRITPKADACGPLRFTSPWQVVARRADGHELGRYPLDLSRFDLNPDHVGRPVRVDGCEVVDTRVLALCSVPRHPDAVELRIVYGRAGRERLVGTVPKGSYDRLLEQGRPR